jgi:hypothetical protein
MRMTHSRSRILIRVILVLCFILIGLALAEGIVRWFDFDWRFVEKNLYYQAANQANFVADPNPEILFRPRPGSSAVYQSGPQSPVGDIRYSVTINSLGFRSEEKPVEKPPGVFRILCFGGSNVFGAAVDDNQTWPAQLEINLNKLDPRRFDVWNMGANAYVGVQMAALATEAVARFDPDMVIFAISNTGPPAFLLGTPVRSYFQKKPSLWHGLTPELFERLPEGLWRNLNRWLFSNIRAYRMFGLAMLAKESDNGRSAWERQSRWEYFENENRSRVREFIENKPDDLTVVLFASPHSVGSDTGSRLRFADYLPDANTPAFYLHADGYPKEYRMIHPPAHVLEWYGERIASWLFENRLVPSVNPVSKPEVGP